MRFTPCIIHLFREFSKRLPVVVLFMIGLGLLEGLGIGVIVPIFEFFFQGNAYESNSLLSRFVFSVFDACRNPISLWSLFGFVIALFRIKNLIAYLQMVFKEYMFGHFFKYSIPAISA